MCSLIIPSNEYKQNIKIINDILESNDKDLILEDLNLEDLNLEDLNKLNNFKKIDKNKVSLCLNMIVRNESKIITY